MHGEAGNHVRFGAGAGTGGTGFVATFSSFDRDVGSGIVMCWRCILGCCQRQHYFRRCPVERSVDSCGTGPIHRTVGGNTIVWTGFRGTGSHRQSAACVTVSPERPGHLLCLINRQQPDCIDGVTPGFADRFRTFRGIAALRRLGIGRSAGRVQSGWGCHTNRRFPGGVAARSWHHEF